MRFQYKVLFATALAGSALADLTSIPAELASNTSLATNPSATDSSAASSGTTVAAAAATNGTVTASTTGTATSAASTATSTSGHNNTGNGTKKGAADTVVPLPTGLMVLYAPALALLGAVGTGLAFFA
ncbi:hypothetical protein DB88DRAFT_525419 [Papiliotrema laurentii]|uniref:Uncharacterized protein n=1 Tax=Papiliotrema laurentii TaxID=5418 RepID=A0AAD9FRD8_PAPLA|nr:hypothetical protein DB88DRAFT_525419 [Papiliotrema laurentii]